MLVKCYMSAHRFSEPNSWTQSLFFKWKVHIDIISKYKVFCTTANTQIYCQPEKYTFLQINSNKNITWDLTVIFQQRGSTEKGLHVIPTMGVRDTGPEEIWQPSYITLFAALTYKCSCTICLLALLPNNPDLN